MVELTAPLRTPSSGATLRKVLNAGSGPASAKRLHSAFSSAVWQEVRLDIDPSAQPDLLGSIADMRGLVPDGSFDAIWSSHNIEHLHPYEIVPALREFRRALKRGGFAFITCPDLAAVSRLILERGLDATIYHSVAGPITPLDMIYGHVKSVASGNTYMCHNSGFTEETLGSVALQSGFAEARVAKGEGYDLWALFLMPDTDIRSLATLLRDTPESHLVEL